MTLRYPKTRSVDAVEDLAGVHAADPYRWLEDGTSDEVRRWQEEQNQLARATVRGLTVFPKVRDLVEQYTKDGEPVLTAGSPSVGLIQNIVQNTVNILDFGLDIETSVHRPRFGGPSLASFLGGNPLAPSYYVEADIDEGVRNQVADRGVPLDVVNPWNFHSGSYEGVHIAADGTASACGDPRRAGRAEAV